jgi:murein DD-endopeptidase MepM/ murein hydrolase activator NlpD
LPGITIENNGIDITTTKGEKVRSIFKGTVTSVFTIPGAGKNIIISHGAYRTVYTNLQEVYVTTGETVDTKQTIGMLMTDEEDKKTVAHLEIWKISSAGTTKQNPASWIYQK